MAAHHRPGLAESLENETDRRTGLAPAPKVPPELSREKYNSRNPAVRFVLHRFFSRLRAVLEEVAPQSLLDAGCGECEMARRGVVPVGVRPICLDMSEAALAEVLPTDRVCSSVLDLPFAPGSFDTITCLEVLEHLKDPGAAVRELARVARRAIVVSVPYEPYFRLGNLLRGKYATALGNHPEHIQHWNPGTFHAFLAREVEVVRVVEACPWIIAWCRPNRP